jgi:prepilin-type N-terminal cleavage/methylation domain-containing protein
MTRGYSRGNDGGFTLIELLIVVAIIAIIAAIAVPGLLRARMTGNETSAIASLKVVTSSQVAYSSACGNGAYAATFVVLGTAPAAGSEGFISADLGSAVAPQKSGYNFTLGAGAGSAAGPNDCNGTATITAYYATAVPMSLNTTGARSFAVNTGNTIWQLPGGAAPTEPFAASGGTPIQ